MMPRAGGRGGAAGGRAPAALLQSPIAAGYGRLRPALAARASRHHCVSGWRARKSASPCRLCFFPSLVDVTIAPVFLLPRFQHSSADRYSICAVPKRPRALRLPSASFGSPRTRVVSNRFRASVTWRFTKKVVTVNNFMGNYYGELTILEEGNAAIAYAKTFRSRV